MVSGLAGTHTLRVIADLPFDRGRVVPISRIVIFGGVFELLNDGLFSRWVNYSLQRKHDCHKDSSSTKPSIVVEMNTDAVENDETAKPDERFT